MGVKHKDAIASKMVTTQTDIFFSILLDNLAALYQEIGEYAEAEPLLLRAAKVFVQALGPDHPDVAISQNNLGTFYEAQGRYADAEMSFQRALAINIRALGSEHPVVASTQHNLAELYQRQGR